MNTGSPYVERTSCPSLTEYRSIPDRSTFGFPWLIPLILVASLVGFLAPARGAEPSEADAPKPAFSKRAVATIGSPVGSTRRYEVDAGRVPFGEKGIIEVELTNDSGGPLNFVNVMASCSCVTASIPAATVPPGDKTTLRMLLDTGRPTNRSTQVVPVELVSEKGPTHNVFVLCKYHLDGLVAFPLPAFSANVSRTELDAKITVPLIVTTPIQINDLVVKVNPDVGHAEAKKADAEPGKDHAAVVELHLQPELLSTSEQALSVIVQDTTTGRRAETLLSIVEQLPISFAPQTLYFRQQEDGNYQATCMLTLQTIEADSQRGGSNQPVSKKTVSPPALDAKFMSKHLQHKLILVTDVHYRVNFTMENDAMQSYLEEIVEKPRVQWSVVWGKEKSQGTSTVVVLGR